MVRRERAVEMTMAKQTPAEVYLQVACAVIASTDRRYLGHGDVVADVREAEYVRAAAKAMYEEIIDEMNILDK